MKTTIVLISIFIHIVAYSFAGSKSSFQKINTDSTKNPPANWFNLDKALDNVFGISTERTYKELLKGKKSRTVVVAVIDSGVDIEHEDLQGKIWKNKKEVEGNNIDDDKNGYVDDVYGWNFIGGKDGKNVNQDTYELTREYARLKSKYENKEINDISSKEKKEYKYYREIKKIFEEKIQQLKKNIQYYQEHSDQYFEAKKMIESHIGKRDVTLEELNEINSSDGNIESAKELLIAFMEQDFYKQLPNILSYYKNQLEYGYNIEFDTRNIVGDNYEDLKERYYGNNDVIGPDASHGTHVAGIIAADRDNDIGIKGIIDNVKIMSIRAVPDGDERDKDVANAIYYAVNNGAKVINMSFGKGYSPDKKLVDKAVKYAESKGVLLIHAAGNSNLNIDKVNNFPTKRYKNKKSFKNWLEVGALSWKKDTELVAPFSNYGKKTVDVFSPGVEIYSTIPQNGYASFSGTSMAAPVTAGVAALLMSYFPDLTALEIKDIILKTTVKIDDRKVSKPSDGDEVGLVKFSDLCNTGGVINLYGAIKMAEKMDLKN